MNLERVRTPVAVLFSAGVVLALGYGVRQSLGLFIAPMSADLGWSRTTFSLAFALQNLIWGCAGPFAGAFADRFGTAKTIAGGLVLYACGMLLVVFDRTPLGFTLGAGIVMGVALSATAFGIVLGPIARAVTAEKRSAALGIVGAVGSLGQMLFPPVAQVAIGAAGWIATMLLFAVVAVCIVPFAVSFGGGTSSVHHEKELPLRAAVTEAIRHPSFSLLNAGFFVCGFHIAFLQTHLPVYVTQQGLPPLVGALALSVIGAFNVAGSYASGALAGRFPKRFVLSAIYALRAVAFVAFLASPPTTLSVLLFSAVIGALWLSTVPVTSAIVAGTFGTRWVSTLFGIVFFSHQVGAFFGAWLGGRIYDLTGSYHLMWVIATALALFAALVNVPIDERPVARLRAATA